MARDYYVAVDGAIVQRGVFSGSGTLSATVSLPDSTGHSVEAWPIINRDRSIYSGELYINGRLVARSNDVHTNSKLRYYISPAQPPLGPTTTRVYLWIEVLDASTSERISGANVYWDGAYVGSTGSDGRLRIDTVYPPASHSYRVTAGGYNEKSDNISIGASSGGGFTVKLTSSASRQGSFAPDRASFSAVTSGSAIQTSLRYSNSLGEDVVVMFVISIASSGKVVDAPTATAYAGRTGTAAATSKSLGSGTYKVGWKAFRASDASFSNVISWSGSNEEKTVTIGSSREDWHGGINRETWWTTVVFSETSDGCGPACVASVINHMCGKPVLSFQDVYKRYTPLPVVGMPINQVAEALTYYANLYDLGFEGRISLRYDFEMVKRLLDNGIPVIIHLPAHYVVAVAYNDYGELLAGTPLMFDPVLTPFSPTILDSVIYLE